MFTEPVNNKIIVTPELFCKEKHLVKGEIEILLVEGNQEDISLVKENFKAGEMAVHHLNIVTDGREALKFLYKYGPYKDAPDADLVLLDLELSEKDGWEILREMKDHNNLRSIPVCMLTPNEQENEILELFSIHTHYFISKPVTAEKFKNLIKSLT